MHLPGRAYVYDVRQGRSLGSTDALQLALDPVSPTILAISPSPLPAPTLSGPEILAADRVAEFEVGFVGPSPAERPALRLEVIDPGGHPTAGIPGT
jgi:hypothetical protein